MSPVRIYMVPCLLSVCALACLAGCRSGQHADSAKVSVEAQPPAQAPTQTAPPTQTKEVPMSVMVDIPAGPFMMGGQPYDNDALPVREVFLSRYSIGKYEVTVRQYMACEADGACTRPVKTYDDDSLFNYGGEDRDRDVYPINGVTWEQAREYCFWEGKRLPTEAEWEKAARGTDRRMYPWGDAPPSCEYTVMYEEAPGCNTYSTSGVGRKHGDVSPYGVHDMAGNVAEWIQDWYDPNYYTSAPTRDPTGPETGSKRVTRGRGYYSTESGMNVGGRNSATPDEANAELGFRCAMSTE